MRRTVPLVAALVCLLLTPHGATTAELLPTHRRIGAAIAAPPEAGFTISCGTRHKCRDALSLLEPPSGPYIDARPFEDRLGRPCGYRWRYAPSGATRVRVCF